MYHATIEGCELAARTYLSVRQDGQVFSAFLLAGDEGFEPPISEPESDALPLGQSPLR